VPFYGALAGTIVLTLEKSNESKQDNPVRFKELTVQRHHRGSSRRGLQSRSHPAL